MERCPKPSEAQQSKSEQNNTPLATHQPNCGLATSTISAQRRQLRQRRRLLRLGDLDDFDDNGEIRGATMTAGTIAVGMATIAEPKGQPELVSTRTCFTSESV